MCVHRRVQWPTLAAHPVRSQSAGTAMSVSSCSHSFRPSATVSQKHCRPAAEASRPAETPGRAESWGPLRPSEKRKPLLSKSMSATAGRTGDVNHQFYWEFGSCSEANLFSAVRVDGKLNSPKSEDISVVSSESCPGLQWGNSGVLPSTHRVQVPPQGVALSTAHLLR